jgi:YesN/AraC family two-component response regulator
VIRVVIADDQALVRDGLRMILDTQDDVEVVGEAANGHEAVRMVSESQPDVVLMDIRMPDLDARQGRQKRHFAEE